MNFPHILDSIDEVPLSIDDLNLEIGDVEVVQTSAGATRTNARTSTTARAIKTARTSGGASSHPSSS